MPSPAACRRFDVQLSQGAGVLHTASRFLLAEARGTGMGAVVPVLRGCILRGSPPPPHREGFKRVSMGLLSTRARLSWAVRHPGPLALVLPPRDEVNKAYRKLAVLLHPDKCVAPGSEDAFKAVVNARTALLKNIK